MSGKSSGSPELRDQGNEHKATELPVNGSMLVQKIKKIRLLVFEILTERGTDGRTDGRIDTFFFVRPFILIKSVQGTMGLRSTVFALRRYIKNIEHNDSIPHILYI